MRNLTRLVVMCCIALMFTFSYGCKKPDIPHKVSEADREEKPDPNEPAPVPKGTPPY